MTQPTGTEQPQWGPPAQPTPQQPWTPQQWTPQQQWGQPSLTQPVAGNPWGSPNQPKKKWPWALGVVLGVLIVGGIASAAQNDKPSASATGPASAPSPASAPAPAQAAAPSAAAAPQDSPASTAAPAPTSWTMPSMSGVGLQVAQNRIQELTGDGIFFTYSHDVGGADRMQILDSDWRVCSQNVAAGTRITAGTRIDFGVVKLGESCP
jgi:hypothetical protein